MTSARAQDFYPGGNKTFYTRYLIEGGWSRLLTDEEQRTFTTAGYFAHRLNDQLTVSDVRAWGGGG